MFKLFSKKKSMAPLAATARYCNIEPQLSDQCSHAHQEIDAIIHSILTSAAHLSLMTAAFACNE